METSQDLEKVCIDCEKKFIFTAGEQWYFKTKGLFEPKRCPSCREQRKRTLVRQEDNR